MDPWELKCISDLLVNCYVMFMTTGKDCYFYVNPYCYALNTHISPPIGYSAFVLLHLHKSVQCTNTEYSTFQQFSKSFDKCMKIMNKRFDVIKKIVLDKTAHDQAVQQKDK